MLVDSHCHLDRLDLTPYSGDFSGVIEHAHAAGLGRMLCVSINLADYVAMRQLVEAWMEIDVSVGVHPNEGETAAATEAELLALGADPRVVAIGETGLDYHWQDCPVAVQQERFRAHIRAARALQKPLIVHCRDASEDTLRILREENAGSVGGVFHCFTGDWAEASQALDQNFLISFSGIVTFKNARVLQDVARRVPRDRYLIETDAPYLAPAPMRGKPNYPAYVAHVADFIAGLQGVSVARVAEESAANYYDLFKPRH
ncbi:TatD family hydrolase [Methylotetracoccus oryzae]|uniref:TatD family hydrolase n=1 Tax=Methylotetracoccus oryzae TaxID=1919059 RepID=UPI00111A5229|nr:TatD family hydrolase [Methylotetracoccus oryzae]